MASAQKIPCTCADCGVDMAYPERLSYYFARPLCTLCYRAERCRPKQDAEVRILEHMYTRTAA